MFISSQPLPRKAGYRPFPIGVAEFCVQDCCCSFGHRLLVSPFLWHSQHSKAFLLRRWLPAQRSICSSLRISNTCCKAGSVAFVVVCRTSSASRWAPLTLRRDLEATSHNSSSKARCNTSLNDAGLLRCTWRRISSSGRASVKWSLAKRYIMGCAVLPGYAKRVCLSISSASSGSPSSRPCVLALRRAR